LQTVQRGTADRGEYRQAAGAGAQVMRALFGEHTTLARRSRQMSPSPLGPFACG